MLGVLVVLSLAGTKTQAPPAQNSEPAPILGLQAAKAKDEQAVGQPPGFSQNGTFFPKAFAEDPLGERWFSGVILIQQGDQEIFSYTKGTDRGGKPFDLDTPFWLASITKTMTAATVMTLAAEGRVDRAGAWFILLNGAAWIEVRRDSG